MLHIAGHSGALTCPLMYSAALNPVASAEPTFQHLLLQVECKCSLLPGEFTMPVHDWTLVEAGIFHDFHVAWLPEIRKVLNGGLLPEGFYALAEQHAGRTIADVLTLHASPGSLDPLPVLPTTGGGTAVVEAPPRVRRRESLDLGLRARRRSVAIRHVSGHRLVALLEIVSPANKDRQQSVDDFAAKAVDALDSGIHLVVVDLFPPGPYDPQDMPGAVRQRLVDPRRLSIACRRALDVGQLRCRAGRRNLLEHLAAGGILPEMPLFLNLERYVSLPLESTYEAAYQGMPAFWRGVLEGKRPPGE